MSTTELNKNSIDKYTQVYDYIKNLKLEEYISNKRDIVHKQLFDNSIDKLIMEVNKDETSCKLAKAIKSQLKLYDLYMQKFISTEDYIKAVNDPNLKYTYKLAPFNKDNFRFIEYKHKIWYCPSKVSIVYTKALVKNEHGKYTRLNIGPLYLGEVWDNKFILDKDVNNIITADKTSKYVIEYIDYVNGYAILYDKINMNYLNIDLNYIKNINRYEFSHNYDEMFSIKRK